jgi:hypothetical protein
MYSLFSRPSDGILSNPKLEYTASGCSSCNLTVVPITDKSQLLDGFIYDNPGVIGKQEPTEELSKNRYIFNRSAFNQEGMILDISKLIIGRYKFILTCNDPDTGDIQTESVQFNLYPYIRWREVMPVMN